MKAEAQSRWVWRSLGEDRRKSISGLRPAVSEDPTLSHCQAGSREGRTQTMSSGQPSPLQVPVPTTGTRGAQPAGGTS